MAPDTHLRSAGRRRRRRGQGKAASVKLCKQPYFGPKVRFPARKRGGGGGGGGGWRALRSAGRGGLGRRLGALQPILGGRCVAGGGDRGLAPPPPGLGWVAGGRSLVVTVMAVTVTVTVVTVMGEPALRPFPFLLSFLFSFFFFLSLPRPLTLCVCVSVADACLGWGGV